MNEDLGLFSSTAVSSFWQIIGKVRSLKSCQKLLTAGRSQLPSSETKKQDSGSLTSETLVFAWNVSAFLNLSTAERKFARTGVRWL